MSLISKLMTLFMKLRKYCMTTKRLFKIRKTFVKRIHFTSTEIKSSAESIEENANILYMQL